jgi:hypothetical protein
MKPVFLLYSVIIVWQVMFPATAYSQEMQGCVLLKTDVNEYSKELETQIVMQKNRILPFRRYNADEKTLEVYYRNIWIPLSSKYTKLGAKGLCSLNEKCAISKDVTGLYADPDFQSQRIGLAYQEQKLTFVGRQKIKDKIWIQVDLGDKIAWVESEKVRIENKACGLSQVGRSAWSFEVEAGGFTSKKINEFQNIFFYDSNQDKNTAKDPIYQVTSIESKSVGTSVVYTKNKHSVSAGIGMVQRTWNYKSYADFRDINPIPPFNCQVVDPKVINESYQEKFVSIPVSYRYQIYSKRNHIFRVRPLANILYNLEPTYNYKHYQPCRTQFTERQNSNLFQAHGVLNLDYLYKLKSIEFGLSIGVENSSGLYLSLLMGF